MFWGCRFVVKVFRENWSAFLRLWASFGAYRDSSLVLVLFSPAIISILERGIRVSQMEPSFFRPRAHRRSFEQPRSIDHRLGSSADIPVRRSMKSPRRTPPFSRKETAPEANQESQPSVKTQKAAASPAVPDIETESAHNPSIRSSGPTFTTGNSFDRRALDNEH